MSKGVKRWDHITSYDDKLLIQATFMGLREGGEYVKWEDYQALQESLDRALELTLKAQQHALDMGNKALTANQLLIEVRGVVYQSYIDRCDPEGAGECLSKIDAAMQGAQP